MRRVDITYRITKIGKQAVSVAVCGLVSMASGVAGAQVLSHNLNDSATLSVTNERSAVEIFYNTASTGASVNYTGSILITLGANVDITGEASVGGVTAAIYSRDKEVLTVTTDTVTFSAANTTLSLNGGNRLTGVVGWHVNDEDEGTADPIDLIRVGGTSTTGGVSFGGAVYATNINLESSQTVSFMGNVEANVNLLSNNGKVSLGAIALTGNITNTSNNGELYLEGGLTTEEGDPRLISISGAVGGAGFGLEKIVANWVNSTTSIVGGVSTTHLDYQNTSTVRIGGTLDLNNSETGVGAVSFNAVDGTLQVKGDLQGFAGREVVTTLDAGEGTVTMYGATQTITGNLGTSAKSIKALNIGGTGELAVNGANAVGSTASTTTANGDIFATAINLRNDSELIIGSGYSLKGNVFSLTDLGAINPGTGTLRLFGGTATQTVDGDVGTSTSRLKLVSSGSTAPTTSVFKGDIYATTVENEGTSAAEVNGSKTTYEGNVYAATVDVGDGLSDFEGSISHYDAPSVATVKIGAGHGKFNTVTGDILFEGAGTALLREGLTGGIDFDANGATVNLTDGKAITGAVTGDSSAPTTVAGTLNALGGGTLSADVGHLTALNVNTEGAVPKTLVANGNITATTITLDNDGELQVADTKTVTGAVVTAADKTGVLTLSGESTVTGNVGAASLALKQINAGATGKTVAFSQGTVFVDTLQFTGNGTVQLNGDSPSAVDHTGALFGAGATDLGLVGTIDFGASPLGEGTLVLADNLDLITQHAVSPGEDTQTSFLNAKEATLRFDGSSVVTGNLGSVVMVGGVATGLGTDTFKSIQAGVANKTVSFRGDVYVSGTTFNLTGTGTVNFLGDLNGPLIFNDDGNRTADADGSVNVADGKRINGPVTTLVDGEGILNFVGATTTQADIGASSFRLNQVNFHAQSSDTTVSPVIPGTANVQIANNIYALTTTIGNGAGDGGATTATITSTDRYLGDNLSLSNSTTLNTAGAVRTATRAAVNAGTALSELDFLTATTADRILNANGTITPVASVTRSAFGAGVFSTLGSTLNFAIGTTPWAGNAGGTVNPLSSSSITGGTGSTLITTVSDTVNVMLLGSLRNGQSHTLIDVTGGLDAETGNTAVPTTLNDNSFVIDTALSRANGESGDLVVTATRGVDLAAANNVYITKSATTGHFSNPAALRLGTLGAAGTNYSEDMQTVFNILDIDQWGFGNNQENLAVQVQRLAPVANNSYVLSAFRAASLVGDSIGSRMHQLRIPEQVAPYEAKGVWVRTVNQADKSGQQGDYDGFKSNTSGAVFGLDAYPNRNALVGVALGYSNTKVKQQDFRQGDEATLQGSHLTLYGALNLTPQFYVGGQITRSWVDTDANRSTAIARVANTDISSDQLSAKIDFGYRFQIPNTAVYITPVASFETSTIDQPAYRETSAGDLGLSVAAEKFRRNQSAVGLRIDGTTTAGGLVVKPEISVMATRDSGTYAKDIRASYIGDLTADPSFTTEVADNTKKTGVKLSLGLGLLLNKTTSMALRYEHTRIGKGENMTSDTQKSDALDIAVRWNF